MKRSRDHHEIDNEHQCNHLRLYVCGESTVNGDGNQPDCQSHYGKEFGGTRQSARFVRQSGNGNARHELKCQQKLVYRFPHSAPLTPADENVAISLNMRTAASISIMASTAPVPSPRRIPRFKIGIKPM